MDDEQIVDKNEPVTDEDLRNLKYGEDGVETTSVEDEPSEPDEPAETSDEAEAEAPDQIEATEEGEAQAEPAFTKQFPNIKGDNPEEYAKNLEIAYQNSTAEALRLKGEVKAPVPDVKPETTTEETPATWSELYAQQKLQEEANVAYSSLTSDYPVLADQASPEYTQFTKEVDSLSRTILASQGRLAPPTELYTKAAIIMGLSKSSEPSDSEKLGTAVKDGAAVSRTNSATKPKVNSKVTPEVISAHRRMYPDDTRNDAEIAKELEPYV